MLLVKNIRYNIALLLLLLASCKKENTIERSFYHWETNFDLTVEECDFLEQNQVKKLYVRYFDLKLNAQKEIFSAAEINFKTPIAENMAIVPVVYITVDVFQALDSTEVEKLAERTYTKITSLHPKESISEIQFDCDWTAGIKGKYFYFLESVKALSSDIKLSSTVRLYQYKYPGISGVPPVDKGVLMYYNMGDLYAYDENNSILNNEIGEQYLGFGEYPLPIDIALPHFSWSILFRYGEFRQLIGNFNPEIYSDTTLFNPIAENLYQVKKDTLIADVYLRYGDELRYENCSEQSLVEAANLLKHELNQENSTILFYDLKSNLTNESTKIDRVFTVFEQ